MVGGQLLDLLIADPRFDQVEAFTRHNTGFDDPKLVEHHIDFGDPATWRELLYGDTLFSCLGTTRGEAGGKPRQFEVDFVYQFNFAAGAAANGVRNYAMVSSAGADPRSMFFYMRVKGELENKVLKLPFRNISILRPTQLYGPRRSPRPAEERALSAVRTINKMGLMKRKSPVNARTVAAAMIEASLAGTGKNIYEIGDIRSLSATYNDRSIREFPESEIVALTEL